MYTYIPDWSKYTGDGQLAPGDFLTFELNGWVTGSWGRHRCTGCLLQDESPQVIVWQKDVITGIQFDPTETDYMFGCTTFFIMYNCVKILFKKI